MIFSELSVLILDIGSKISQYGAQNPSILEEGGNEG